MKRNLIILGAYWLIASSSFIWRPCILGRINFLNIIESIGWCVLALIVMFLIVYYLHDRTFSVVFLSLFMPIISLLRIIFLTNEFYLRSFFCAISAISFILLFNAVLYFEKTVDMPKNHINLVHCRYLEYLRSFIWLVIFGVVGYLAWELNWELAILSHAKNLPDTSNQFPLITGLLQLTSIFTIGVGLVSYAFYVKLKDIEQIT